MLVAALSSGHKLGLGLVALALILFALASSFLLPRLRPNYPGRGLGLFLVVALGFFFAMLAAVEVFGKEPKEAKAGEKTHEARGTSTPAFRMQVKEVDFKITLASTSLKAGAYTFEVHNEGKSSHNLAIAGPGVTAKSATIGPGKTTTVSATLAKGTYEFYCAVPGHKQAGMDVKATVA